MKRIAVQRSGFNKVATFLGPIWYMHKGMTKKGLLMLLISLCSLGIGILPVWLYCGYNANRDFYQFLKNKSTYIF